MDAVERTFTLKIKELKAVRLFASDDESRYILCGVRCEVRKDGVLILATDGRTLAVMDAITEFTFGGEYSFVIPNDAVDSMIKCCTKDSTISVRLEPELVILTLGTKEDAAEIRCKPIVGNYPEWRQIIPPKSEDSITEIGLASIFAERFAKASKLLADGGGLKLAFRKDAGADVLISGVPNFYGLWMPMKFEGEPVRSPAWIV